MNEQEAKKEIAQAKEELLEAKAKLKELNAKLMELSERDGKNRISAGPTGKSRTQTVKRIYQRIVVFRPH